jgi:sarcosine oxidase subunit alpha
MSPVLGRAIALALVEGGRDRLGEEVGIFHLGETRRARIVPACSYDPEGTRRDG